MDRQTWLLIALDFAGPRALSPAQLQKSLFLLGRELPGELGTTEFYLFKPYNYGPFCKQIYEDAEWFAEKGLVSISQTFGRQYPEYAITPQGHTSAAQLRIDSDNRALSYLSRVVTWAQGTSFSELVTTIYKKYPEFRENSVFRD